MLFNTFHFLVFFPLVVIAYFILPYKFRRYFLLAASCYFYMAFIPIYILILFGLIVVDYFAGLAIENSQGIKKRKFILVLSIISNLGILAVFKYYNFFIDNISDLCTYFEIDQLPFKYLTVLLPVGLSFHTFQSMSYTIEVFRKNQKAERNIFTYALYVMFFPQLVAGPIERPQNLLMQLKLNHDIDYTRIIDGLKQMLWGFFKKIVIADRLGALVKQGYGNIDYHDGPSLLIYTYLFAFQIYCDFSGYSDIAIGASKILGIKLSDNFRTPYLSQTIKEFWHRWHISLASWFRDYLYIPLGGNQVKRWRWFYNITIVFLLSGFWHGANWTFIVWGALHASYMICGHFYYKFIFPRFYPIENKKSFKFHMRSAVNVFITFNLVSFAWIFFRAKDIGSAVDVVLKITLFRDYDSKLSLTMLRVNDASSIFVTISLLILFLLSDSFMDKISKQQKFFRNRKVSFAVYATILAFILIFGHFTDTNFIYYQF